MDQYNTIPIPLKEIYSDTEFNCRGVISPLDVNDLAQSIKSTSLQTPINVQPAADVKGGLPPGYKYRIVAGHRRFKAFQVLAASDPATYGMIPSMVKTGLSDIDARVLNIEENLHRQDLNIMQEARAIKSLYDAGVPREQVAFKLKMSAGWVQVRFMLLSLPEEIQTDAAAGFLTQTQIRQLYSLESVDEQYAAVRKIKDAKMRNEKVENVGKKRKTPITAKKERRAEEMTDMSELMAKSIGYGLATRTLAWAAGYITSAELYSDIAVEAQRLGKAFTIPRE